MPPEGTTCPGKGRGLDAEDCGNCPGELQAGWDLTVSYRLPGQLCPQVTAGQCRPPLPVSRATGLTHGVMRGGLPSHARRQPIV